MSVLEALSMQMDRKLSLLFSADTPVKRTLRHEEILNKILNQQNDGIAIFIANAEKAADMCDRHAEFMHNLPLEQLSAKSVLVSTPEKCLQLMCNWRQYKHIISTIQFFIVDDAQLLNDHKQGAALEVLVTRMKTIAKALKFKLRFIVGCNNLYNLEDVKEWISTDNYPLQILGSSTFPAFHVEAIDSDESNINSKIATYIRENAGDKKTLVLCSDSYSTEYSAKDISKEFVNDAFFTYWERTLRLKEESKSLLHSALKEILSAGIAFYHDGVPKNDRERVLDYFSKDLITVLFATISDLKQVSLPSCLLIIKHTNEGEVSSTIESILPMYKQCSSSKNVIVFANAKTKKLYEELSGKEIDSQLKKCLKDYLVAEIALKPDNIAFDLQDWLKKTFLYVRAKRSNVDALTELTDHCQPYLEAYCTEGILTYKSETYEASTSYELMIEGYLPAEKLNILIKETPIATNQRVLGLVARGAKFAVNATEGKNIIKQKIARLRDIFENTIPDEHLEESQEILKIAVKEATRFLEIICHNLSPSFKRETPIYWFKALLVFLTKAKDLHDRWCENSQSSNYALSLKNSQINDHVESVMVKVDLLKRPNIDDNSKIILIVVDGANNVIYHVHSMSNKNLWSDGEWTKSFSVFKTPSKNIRVHLIHSELGYIVEASDKKRKMEAIAQHWGETKKSKIAVGQKNKEQPDIDDDSFSDVFDDVYEPEVCLDEPEAYQPSNSTAQEVMSHEIAQIRAFLEKYQQQLMN